MQDLKESNAYRSALRERIMDAAMGMFADQGIKAVKMDDIARRLAISKRTLYEIYQDKEELLYQCIVEHDQKRYRHIDDFIRQGHNVIDIIVEAYHMKLEETQKVNPLFYVDIMKYPKVERYIKDEHERTRKGFLDFMHRGVKEGCLRPDINYELIPHLLEAIGAYFMSSPDMLKQYPLEEVFNNLVLVSFRGLCTPKGARLLDEALDAKIR